MYAKGVYNMNYTLSWCITHPLSGCISVYASAAYHSKKKNLFKNLVRRLAEKNYIQQGHIILISF